MNKFIHDSWNVVMNSKHNPLRNIPDINTRHLVMQLLAWMWCIIFSIFRVYYRIWCKCVLHRFL